MVSKNFSGVQKFSFTELDICSLIAFVFSVSSIKPV